MQQLLTVVPLLAILILIMPPFRFHVLVAGLVGGALAVAIGGLSAPKVTELFFAGMTQILDIKSVMLFAATAMVLARCGCTNAIMELMTQWFGSRTELIAAAMVLVQAAATYMAGIGAANTLVTAPLVFAAVGFVPLAVVGMSIVSGASWATSPSSAEAAYISKQMGISASEYASYMLPYTLVFWLIGALIAWYGVRRYRLAGRLTPGQSPGSQSGSSTAAAKGSGEVSTTNAPGTDIGVGLNPFRRATPFFVMLVLILIGPPLNRAIGIPLFSAVLLPLWILIITAVLLKVNPTGSRRCSLKAASPFFATCSWSRFSSVSSRC